MFVVRLSGGLGNQLFQYAFGRAISLDNNCPLLIDIDYFDIQHERSINDGLFNCKFELNKLTMQLRLWNNSMYRFFPISFLDRVFLKVKKLLGFTALVYEHKYGFDENIVSKIRRHTYFSGYWQSPIYFEKYRSILLEDFQFILPESRNILLEEKIKNVTSVSIHVRRGDYVNNKEANKIHGLCSEAYYKTAVDTLFSKYNAIDWFIFSDDIDWCKNHFLTLQNCTFIESNKWPDYYDMYLMSLCKHNIIANSSFSWWGAWLNQNPNKTVIGPSRWFADSVLNTQIDGILPNTWIRI